MTVMLILGSILAVLGLLGSFAGSAMGLGPALVGLACYCGIVARILQARQHP